MELFERIAMLGAWIVTFLWLIRLERRLNGQEHILDNHASALTRAADFLKSLNRRGDTREED